MTTKAFKSLAMCAGLLLVGVTPAAIYAQNPPKVAVINVVQLLEDSDAGQKGIEDLKALQKQKTDERSAMQAAVQELRTKISDGQFSLAEDKLEDLKKELEDKLIDLQRFNDDANRALQKEQEKMLLEIQNQVMPIINAVGKENGYTMIFNKFESGMVYVDEAIDITDEVMVRLNSATAAAAAEPTESGG